MKKKPMIKKVLVEALSSGPLTTAELVQVTGLEKRCVQRNLWHLSKYGIARRKWVLA